MLRVRSDDGSTQSGSLIDEILLRQRHRERWQVGRPAQAEDGKSVGGVRQVTAAGAESSQAAGRVAVAYTGGDDRLRRR
jgi:hypothetical protein